MKLEGFLVRLWWVGAPLLACLLCLPAALRALGPGVVAAGEGTVTYSFFPTSYAPGSPVQVTLTANQYSWGTRVVIRDTFPSGWTPSATTPPATMVGNTLEWKIPLGGSSSVTVQYKATPPAGAAGIATFHHWVEFSNDSTSQETSGDRLIAAAGDTCTLDCSATASPASGFAPLLVRFSGGASPSGCTGTVAYDWGFGDGTPHSSEQSPSHTYGAGGAFPWKMTASVQGVTCSKTGTVNVAQTPPVGSAGTNVAVVVTAARVAGAANSFWVSDLLLHNPGDTQAAVNLYFMEAGQDNSAALGRRLVVPAGQSLKLANVVGDTFGEASASGALLVGSDLPLLITSRTYNNASTGTYGQYVEGCPLARAITAGQEVRLIGLSKNTGYRTNIGFANPTAASLAVQVDLYTGGGTSLGQRNYTLQPWSYFQENDVFGKVTAASIDDAYAVVRSATTGARFFTYASVIDNRTGDAVQVAPLTRRRPAGAGRSPGTARGGRQGGDR